MSGLITWVLFCWQLSVACEGQGSQEAKRRRDKYCAMQQTVFALLQHFSNSQKLFGPGFFLTSLLVNLTLVAFVEADLPFTSFISTRLWLFFFFFVLFLFFF